MRLNLLLSSLSITSPCEASRGVEGAAGSQLGVLGALGQLFAPWVQKQRQGRAGAGNGGLLLH